MPKKGTSRRRFIQSTVSGMGVGSLGLLGSAAADERSHVAESTTSGRKDPLPVFSEICPQHVQLLMRRSANRHKHIKASLKREGARPLTVGAYQMRNHCDGEKGKESNLGRMLKAVGSAARLGVEMLAFPEMCLPGYFTPISGTADEAVVANHRLSDEIGCSRYVKRLQDAARKADMVLAFGFCEKDGDAYYNSIGVIDADGNWLGTRRKNPLYPYPYETKSFAQPDPSLRSAVFKTRYAKIGISNCFDGEFPESIRRMRLDGAEVLLWCNAALGNSVLGTSHRINHSGAHAQANHMWVICCNCVAANASGTSVIVGPSGEHLVILPPSQEALGTATLNLALSANWDTWRDRLSYQ